MSNMREKKCQRRCVVTAFFGTMNVLCVYVHYALKFARLTVAQDDKCAARGRGSRGVRHHPEGEGEAVEGP